MADPKYAGLPGIAVDQPDMYESSDQPEYEQVNYQKIEDPTFILSNGNYLSTYLDKGHMNFLLTSFLLTVPLSSN